MRICVVLEQRFFGTSDGAVWTDGPCPCSFWSRYRAVFDEVRVIARVKPVAAALREWVRADGEGIVFAPVPHYLGPWEYLRKSRAVRRAVRQAVGPEDAVILRVSSNLAGLLFPALRRTEHPYAVEVLADPYDVFAPKAVPHPLRPWFRTMFVRALRAHCRHACAAAYVTAETLQRRYPPGPGTYCVHYSDVQIDGLIAQSPRPAASPSPCGLVLVGTLAQLYKAPDVLIDAVGQCTRGGLDLRLTFVGDGKYRAQLEARAAGLGLGDRVSFRGQLPAGEAIREELDRAGSVRAPVAPGGVAQGDDRGHGPGLALHRLDRGRDSRVAPAGGHGPPGRCGGLGGEDPRGRHRPAADGADVGPES